MRTNASRQTSTLNENIVKKTYSRLGENIVLDGVKSLRIEKLNNIYEKVLHVNPLTGEERFDSNANKPFNKIKGTLISTEKIGETVFPLTEVTPEDLNNFRDTGVPSFVLKVDGKLFHSEIPDDLNLISSNILGPHLCVLPGHECFRLSPLSDEEGGCEKVRNRSNNIERYPWITTGYETFNTKRDSFVVVNCLQYEKYPPRKTSGLKKPKCNTLGLAQFLYPHIEDSKQLLEIMVKNGVIASDIDQK